MKTIFAAALIFTSLCSCATHNDANRNLVGVSVVGDDQYATVSHVRKKRTANGLPINTAGNMGRVRGSIGWKGHEQFMTANCLLSDTVVFCGVTRCSG